MSSLRILFGIVYSLSFRLGGRRDDSVVVPVMLRVVVCLPTVVIMLPVLARAGRCATVVDRREHYCRPEMPLLASASATWHLAYGLLASYIA